MMGCICGKAAVLEDSRESMRKRQSKGSSELRRVSRVTSTRREESFRVKQSLESGAIRTGAFDKTLDGSNRVRDLYFEKKVVNFEVVVPGYPAIVSIPKATEGEQVAAGWPSWLAAVAGEAIKGWVPRRADSFEKLDKIGQGTYSSVYKARDLIHKKVVALKRVRFESMEPESVKFMAREILILRRLDHPNIIKLEGLITSRNSSSLYLIFEYMEHDLTGLISLPGVKFSEPQVKCYMEQLLSGLNHSHNRGVLHRDIKGSNLLIDNRGILKIADFGLASFFDPHRNVPLTSRVVTLWYRPPELLLGAVHYGVSVDLWSSGCILGELYAGRPIMPGRTEVEQLHKIFKLCGSPSEDYWRKSKLPHATVFKPAQPYKRRLAETFSDLPSAVVGLMDTLLSFDPEHRGTAASALESEYFTTKPLACDPSCLPKYPPSKEIDAKLREDESRRKEAAGSMSQGTGGTKLPRSIPAPHANAELVTSMQRRQGMPISKSRSELFDPYEEDAAAGFPMDPPRRSQAVKEVSEDLMNQKPKRASFSGPLVAGVGVANTGKKYEQICIVSARAGLSTLSGLVASRTLSEECRDKLGPSRPDSRNQVFRSSDSSEVLGHSRKYDRNYCTPDGAGYCRKEKGRTSSKEPVRGSQGGKIRFSGPLLGPSSKVDQMLKDHERQIQEATRRARLEKGRLDNVQARGMQTYTNPIHVSRRGAS